ncbi:MAG: LamG domain-containing protein, partial [Planctomycetota bacterium]
PLDFWTTYYWAVDEVNLAASPDTWPGPVWSFATKGFVGVDDFDSYVNTTQLDAVWDDYYDNDTGAVMFIEKDAQFTRDGNSLRFDYYNDEYYKGHYVGSRIDADIANLAEIDANWTAGGAKALVLYFYGQPGNSATEKDIMWVQLDDTSGNTGYVVYDGDANDVMEPEWHEWNILLSVFDACGVDLTNVNRIHIGFGGYDKIGVEEPGGSGTVYFDDIEVWPSRCRSELVPSDFDCDCESDIWDLWLIAHRWLISEGNVPAEPAPDSSAGGLLVRYEFEETSGVTAFDSSGNGYNGTVSTDLGWSPTGGYDGNGCLDFTGDVDVQVPSGVWDFPMDEVTISAWIKPESLTAGDTYAPFGGGDDGQDAGGTWSDWWLLSMIYMSDWGDGTPGYEVVLRSSYEDMGEWYAWDEVIYYDPNTDGWQGWHHYAFVKNANRGTQSIYLDGELVVENYWAADRLIQPIDPNHDGFAIGYSGSTEWGWGRFTGRMDDFRIYDHALRHSQIVDLAGKTLVYQPYVGDDADIDTNNDHIINFGDYVFMAGEWLQEPILWP